MSTTTQDNVLTIVPSAVESLQGTCGSFVTPKQVLCSDISSDAQPDDRKVILDHVNKLVKDVITTHPWVFWTKPSISYRKPKNMEAKMLNNNGPVRGAKDLDARMAYLNKLSTTKPFTSVKAILEHALAASENNAKIFLFKKGIKPVWEERANFNGGRFYISCETMEKAVNVFLLLITKFLVGGFSDIEELCGIVCSIKKFRNKFSVQLWNKNANRREYVKDIRKKLKKLLKKNVLYYVHRTSLKITKYGMNKVTQTIEEANIKKAQTKQVLSTPQGLASTIPVTTPLLIEEKPKQQEIQSPITNKMAELSLSETTPAPEIATSFADTINAAFISAYLQKSFELQQQN